MSDQKGSLGTFGWASAAALVAFVASTYLPQQAFDALRPAERQAAPAVPVVDADVSARLWEDPVLALRRHDAERAERCRREQDIRRESLDCLALLENRMPERLLRRLDKDRNGRLDDTLILVALMPGADSVGAQEARRRLRYATLAGLMAQAYVPDHPERLGLLEFRTLDVRKSTLKPSAASAQPLQAMNSSEKQLAQLTRQRGNPVMPVLYETLSRRRLARDGADGGAPAQRYGQVAVLWVDENLLPPRKFDSLARLVDTLMGDAARADVRAMVARGQDKAADPPSPFALPRLAVIGPSSTDALRTAITDLRCAAERRNAAAGVRNIPVCGEDTAGDLDASAVRGYELLAGARYYNTASTAPNGLLAELQDQKLEAFVSEQFRRINRQQQQTPVRLIRTIAPDNDLIKRLVAELHLRLPGDAPRRLVIVAERDSLYSQSLVTELRRRLNDDKQLSFDVVYFFRGLDGQTGRDKPASAGRAPTDDAKRPPDATPAEWPEGSHQLDYLRRIGQSLHDLQTEPGAVPIGAIGIFANDVHDKLLILQALHAEFSDKTFFTTDLDARFLHAKVQDFTRNLIVASSLPLAFHPGFSANGVALQDGTPPMRDAYQASAYLAARHAGCAGDECRAAERDASNAALDEPSVYEIGRDRAVPLSGYAHRLRPVLASNLLAAATLGSLIALGLLVWPSTPSLRRARRAFLHTPDTQRQRLDMGSFVLAALQIAVLAFVQANLIEFAQPNAVNFVHMLWLGSLGGFAAVLAMLPAVMAPLPVVPLAASAPPRLNRLHISFLIALVAGWVWLAWPRAALDGRGCVDCEPVLWFQGVSAWPSHLLHLLALVVTVGAFDHVWSGTQRALGRDGRWLRMDEPSMPRLRRLTPRLLAAFWHEHFSVLMWPSTTARPHFSCNAQRLWLEYGWRGQNQARATRILSWLLMTVGAVALLFFSMSEGQLPEIPVRGEQHRQMVRTTLYALVLLVPLLIVSVVDATVCLLVFVRHLNAGRSFYPQATLAACAQSLGPLHRDQWLTPLAARPKDRYEALPPEPDRVHTLLDPWIDVQLVARRSKHIARLVYWPFVVLALLVMARSRGFDNWSVTPAIAAGLSIYVAALIALTLLLKQACEQTRQRALEAMRADLRWMQGSAELSHLSDPFRQLIVAVESIQTGAFAPFLEQPLLRSLLVPLGGAGGTQLFEQLLR